MIRKKYTNKGRSFNRILLAAFIIMLTTSGCKKFLAGYSQNRNFLQSTSDLEEILLGQGYMIFPPPFYVHQLDDDAERNPSTDLFTVGNSPVFKYFGVTFWQEQPYVNNQGKAFEDPYFTYIYRSIAALNTILHDIPKMRSNGEPEDQLQRISGEAHFLRAWNYFNLNNVYGKPYNAATAAADYSVPLKTDPAIEDKRFSRNKVKEVFDLIVSDLLTAEKELENFKDRGGVRPETVTVQALLSRVYLYMADYEKANNYADKVISTGKYRVWDLNNFPQGAYFSHRSSPEIIFCFPLPGSSELSGMMNPSNTSGSPDNFMVSADLRSSYTENDLRLSVFFQKAPAGEVLYRKTPYLLNDIREDLLFRFSEILLNKAEALAALGRNEEAAATIQDLRKRRFKPEQLTAVTQTGAALVKFIREERRRELCFECHRWMDLRRYAVNPDFPFEKSIRHISYAYTLTGRVVEGYYELKPYSQDKAAWLLPLPKSEIELSQGELQNEQRPKRQLIQ